MATSNPEAAISPVIQPSEGGTHTSQGSEAIPATSDQGPRAEDPGPTLLSHTSSTALRSWSAGPRTAQTPSHSCRSEKGTHPLPHPQMEGFSQCFYSPTFKPGTCNSNCLAHGTAKAQKEARSHCLSSAAFIHPPEGAGGSAPPALTRAEEAASRIQEIMARSRPSLAPHVHPWSSRHTPGQVRAGHRRPAAAAGPAAARWSAGGWLCRWDWPVGPGSESFLPQGAGASAPRSSG